MKFLKKGTLEDRIKEDGLIGKIELIKNYNLKFIKKNIGMYVYKDKKDRYYFFSKKHYKTTPLYELHFTCKKNKNDRYDFT